MKKYRCIKEFVVGCYDGDGFRIENKEKVVNKGEIYELDESESTIIGGDVHLDGEDGSWLELSYESFAELFEKVN